MILRLRLIKSLFILLIIISAATYGQPAEIPFHIEAYSLESGVYNGTKDLDGASENVFSGIVQIDNAPWLSLRFSEANLGEESYIIIKSLKDNLWQKLNTESLEQWKLTSAYFNGDAVEVQLFVAPFDEDIFINVYEVVVGEWENENQIESICDGNDFRVASNHPAVGRIVNVGCTGWIIPTGKIISAGHCFTASLSVLQFNVPMSLPNGTIQHPGPEDQYSVNPASRISVSGGVGNDWGVFEVFPNSVTNLTPQQAQNAYFTLVQDYSPVSIRITGHGVDGPPPNFGSSGARDSMNQTQQTHVGPNAGSSNFTMRYRVDTQGGNSGSPIIDESTGFALGVHTHGGCTSTGGNNSGTSFFRTDFWNAVDQGVPVELVSFSAAANDKDVILNWSTASELNNQGFEIERGINGNFKKVGFVPGLGTTSESGNYSFTDYNVANGIYSYRLKQIDFNGAFEYSPVVKISIDVPSVYALEQNYPNPFNPSTLIRYSIPQDGMVNLAVYSLLGEKIATLVNEVQKAGRHEISFDASLLASGIYFYRIEAGSFTSVKKMLLLK
jgi:hypothetical protein